MSEPKYPRAWGVWYTWESNTNGGFLCPRLWETQRGAEHYVEADASASLVEFIPLPEHQAIVAAAVAAERERCAGIADAVAGALRPKKRSWEHAFAQVASETAEQIAEKIREVPS